MSSSSRTVKRFVRLLAVVAFLSFVATLFVYPPAVSSTWFVAFATLLTLNLFAIYLGEIGSESGSSSRSVESVSDMAGVLLLGPAGAVFLSLASEAFWFVFGRSKRRLVQRVFNVSQLLVSVAAGAWAFKVFGGTERLLAPIGFDYWAWTRATLPPFLIGAVAYSLVNKLLVAAIISMTEQRSLIKTWDRTTSGLVLFDAAMSPLGLLWAFLFLKFGALGLLLALVPLVGLRYSYGINIELRKLNADLLRLMVKTIEAQDPYTSGHSVRVSETAGAIARKLGLRSKEVEKIETAALLHDIGKIDIAYSEILRQEGPLTEEQRELIRAHPDRGVDILRSVRSISTEILECVRHHHERFDGDGYPVGVSGKDIPLGARIIMVCDTIDAMTTARPYRGPLPIEVVRQELQRHSGTQFDSDIIDAMLASGVLESIGAGLSTPTEQSGPPVLVQPVLKAEVV